MICMPCLKALLCPEDGNIDPVIARSHGGEAIPTTGEVQAGGMLNIRKETTCDFP